MLTLSRTPPPAVTSARRAARLLVVDGPAGTVGSRRLADLSDALVAGDVLIVNDAATLPASFAGHHAPTREPVEARLLQPLEPGPLPRLWRAVLFGAGDWRTPTEHRPAPPPLAAGDALVFPAGLAALVRAVDPHAPRLVTLEFRAAAALAEPLAPARWLDLVYHAGRPVQYSYHRRPLDLWDHQTLFAVRPVALEPPSAAMQLTWRDVLSLRRRGVAVATLTHATGLSSTGDAWIDAHLPFPERYHIPSGTAALIADARRTGRRVIALGTGVMRALESAALAADGRVGPGDGETALKIGPATRLRVVSGLVTGLHEPESSHMRLLGSLVGESLLGEAYELALAQGYLWHEYGDTSLILSAAPVAS